MYKNKKIFILGMARSGYEVAKLLAPENEIFITDMKEQEEDKVKELKEMGVTFKVSDKAHELLNESYDLVIKNPGIKYDHPCVLKARELNIPVVNEVGVAYHYIDKSITSQVLYGIHESRQNFLIKHGLYIFHRDAYPDAVYRLLHQVKIYQDLAFS